MWTMIIGALLNLLVWAFEKWWGNNHPAASPAPTKADYLKEVGRFRHFWMGPKRVQYASKLFDKAVAAYEANPPTLAEQQGVVDAHALAERYTQGLTLDKE